MLSAKVFRAQRYNEVVTGPKPENPPGEMCWLEPVRDQRENEDQNHRREVNPHSAKAQRRDQPPQRIEYRIGDPAQHPDNFGKVGPRTDGNPGREDPHHDNDDVQVEKRCQNREKHLNTFPYSLNPMYRPDRPVPQGLKIVESTVLQAGTFVIRDRYIARREQEDLFSHPLKLAVNAHGESCTEVHKSSREILV